MSSAAQLTSHVPPLVEEGGKVGVQNEHARQQKTSGKERYSQVTTYVVESVMQSVIRRAAATTRSRK